MKFINNILKSITFLLLVMSGANSFAVDLRGRIDGHDRYRGYYSAAKTEVVIYSDTGRDLKKRARTYTGRDGFYYFRNIKPGSHVIIVGGKVRVPIRINNTRFQDIDPILLGR